MKKSKLTIKSILDGLSSYWIYYLWTAFLIWLGFYLFSIIKLSYWQSLGAIIVIRQIVGIIRNPTDRHLPELKKVSVSEGKWISIKESLPEKGQKVYGIINGRVELCYIRFGNTWSGERIAVSEPPTYWMPVPALPAEELLV